MSKIGLLIPTQVEWNAMHEYIKTDSQLEWNMCGMGKVNSAIGASSLINIGCDTIILFGYAGGLRGLDPGAVIEPSEYIEGDFHAEPIGIEYPNSMLSKHSTGLFRRVPIVSQDRFLNDDIYERTILAPILATDMEAYSVAKVCEVSGVKFYCVRIISDSCNSEASGQFLAPSLYLKDKLLAVLRDTIKRLRFYEQEAVT